MQLQLIMCINAARTLLNFNNKVIARFYMNNSEVGGQGHAVESV